MATDYIRVRGLEHYEREWKVTLERTEGDSWTNTDRHTGRRTPKLMHRDVRGKINTCREAETER